MNDTEAALEEAQGQLQAVQDRPNEGVGAVPGVVSRPEARRPHPGRRPERGRAAAGVARSHLPRVRRQRPLRQQGQVPGLRLRLLHGDVPHGASLLYEAAHNNLPRFSLISGRGKPSRVSISVQFGPECIRCGATSKIPPHVRGEERSIRTTAEAGSVLLGGKVIF